MLARDQIEDIIHTRLAEGKIRECLLSLSPDELDLETLETFHGVLSETLDPRASRLALLGRGAIDCTGTGGSGLPHFNTSTTVSFVLAAYGLPVIKCGNSAMSGRSGSFDFLSMLGFPPNIQLDSLEELFARTNLLFLYAQQLYPKLAALSSIRRAIGKHTIFNFVGPLLNPAAPDFRLVGVAHPAVQILLGKFLSNKTRIKKAMIVRGENGLDEFIVSGVTFISMISPHYASQQHYAHSLAPGRVTAASDARLLTPQINAEIFHNLISGIDNASDHYHSVCLNAGAAFFIAGAAKSIEAGTHLSATLLADGYVQDKYEEARRAYASHIA